MTDEPDEQTVSSFIVQLPPNFRPVRKPVALTLSDSQLADLEPTLTASEVKVLTETARQETADRIAAEADRIADRYQATANEHRALSIEHRTSAQYSERHFKTALAFKNKADGAWAVAQIARDLSSQAAGATSDATSGVPGHQEVSEAVRSPQEPCGHPTCPCTSQEAR
jgi:hypothetical protein